MNRFVSWRLAVGFFLIFTAIGASAQRTRDSTNAPPRGGSSERGFITGGKSSVSRLPPVPEMNCGVSTVNFEAGARTIWHSHAGGQIIVVTMGTAWYQEKGKPKRVLKQGEALICPPGIMHWHGATPEAAMTHTVATPNLDKGGVTSGEPVTEQEYKSTN